MRFFKFCVLCLTDKKDTFWISHFSAFLFCSEDGNNFSIEVVDIDSDDSPATYSQVEQMYQCYDHNKI